MKVKFTKSGTRTGTIKINGTTLSNNIIAKVKGGEVSKISIEGPISKSETH